MNRLFVVLLLAVGPGLARAQEGNAPAQNESRVALFFSAPEVVLPRLYEAAIQHSAEIARLEAGKGMASEDIRLARKHTLSMFSLTSSYVYGTLPYFATADSSTPVYQLNPFNQGARAQYSLGVNVAMPLDVLLGRRNSVHRQELALDQATAARNTAESAIREIVIKQYQALTLARVAMQSYQDALQSAGIIKKLADKKFKEGEIPVDEQIAAIDFYNKAVLAEAEARNKYQTALYLMENLLGMSINHFMQQR